MVATKLQKGKRETFSGDWRESADYQNVANAVHEKFGVELQVFPLKFSKVFDNIFEEQKSIQQMMKGSGLAKYNYREVAEQFEEIYQAMEI